MSLATRAPSTVSRGAAIALAAAGPVAIGGILAARLHDPRPMVAAPAIVFGVIAATAPALYIATAAAGHAPPLAAMARAFGVALGGFGIALAGLILPAAFAALSSVSTGTAIAAATAAIAAAGLLGLRRLASELAAGRPGAGRSLAGGAVFLIWAASALAIAGRLWWELAVEVGS
ncbi:MAG TPA: hypothetical protein VHT91_49800 [Kofleriaceae bacterium]|jgi:hypothetical protein|nr:hypothetical protein [Kofleriaceae bacterium]